MPDLTPNLSLKKPFGNENVTRAAYNENLDILDAAAVKAEDFAAHTGNDVQHTIQAEKDAWNAKETPTGAQAKVNAHANRTDNPHSTTKSQVGLANVENVNVLAIRTDSAKKLRAEVKSSAPEAATNGDIWYDSSTHKFKGYANGAWI